MVSFNIFFGVFTDQGTPRQVFTLQRGNIIERDSHSGLSISTTTNIANGQLTIDNFIRQL
jgi:hypothetical protein